MAKIIEEAQDYTIGDVLKEHYAVPEFQRPYVWKRNTVKIFFDDLFDAYTSGSRGREYFIGSIVVYRDGRTRRLQLVDGQQRMLTLTLLFAACRDRVRQLSHSANTSFYASLLSGPKRTTRGSSKNEHRVHALTDPDREILASVIDGDGRQLDPADFPARQRQLVYAYWKLLDELEERFNRSHQDVTKFTQFIVDRIHIVRSGQTRSPTLFRSSRPSTPVVRTCPPSSW